MTLPIIMAGVLWLGVTVYALFGGADFGAGFWDLFAGSAEKGKKQRALIERSIGPIWEANHVWLIFVLVTMWTCFPVLFGSVTSTLWIPFTLAGFGVIARGSAFAFRHEVKKLWQQRIFGATFALSSIITPFFFGAIAGAVASNRVPVGVGHGDQLTSWLNPVSMATGLLAVVVCAYLAAVYLTADARRSGDLTLVKQFRRRAMGAGIAAGIVAVGGLLFLYNYAPTLGHELLTKGLLLVLLSGFAGIVTLVLLYARYFVLSRVVAAVAVVAVLWGWALSQYPYMLSPGLSIQQAASEPSVLTAVLISFLIGAVFLIPSLFLLYRLFQKK